MPRTSPHVAVVGAGAFGGWTALSLVRRGARVTLIDPWGAGNSRSSSGGESRLLRATYGDVPLYVDWTLEAVEAWRGLARSAGEPGLLRESGLLWWLPEGSNGDYLDDSRPHLAARGWPLEELTPAEAARRWPGIVFDDVERVVWEPRAGVLAARRATRVVAAAVAAAGGTTVRAAAAPPPSEGGRLGVVELVGGGRVVADAFVFAAGPWLPTLFPELLGETLRVTRQKVAFLGPPAAASAALEALPPFLELGPRILYGMPDHGSSESGGRGFKIADDTRGSVFEPTAGDRRLDPGWTEDLRAWAARRFPGLAGAALIESRVCQYTSTPDGDLLLGRHPTLDDAWIAGAGCGHGFKLGPAVGERLAAMVLGGEGPPERVSTSRIAAWRGAGAWRSQFDG